jgi:colicin import membrane protein
MRGPTLQKATIISFTLHLTVFAIALVILKQSGSVRLPSPYTVNLVSPGVLKDMGRETTSEAGKESTRLAAPADVSKKPVKETPKDKPKDAVKEKEMVAKRIAAIEAKKKVERRVKLRSVIALKADAWKHGSNMKQQQSASHGKGSLQEDYYTIITREIWQQWVYPDTGKKDIEAIVAIRILRDGTAIIQRIEKSSGNALFDKSALRALAKASPLPPPPDEMEIGVRFFP